MTQVRFVTMDVFTRRPFGGNPLAIFPEADGLDAGTMQMIANELALSETVFLMRSETGAAARARIFTPQVELPFAGHPTVGATAFLADELSPPRAAVSLEIQAGRIEAVIERGGDGVCQSTITSPRLPVAGPAFSKETAASVLGIDPESIAVAPQGYEAGVPFCFIGVSSRDVLASVAVDLALWEAEFRHSWAPQLYVFTMMDWVNGDTVYARMFAPAFGIPEDPATGGGAAAFAGLLCDLQRPSGGTRNWTIYQGLELGRPSEIGLQVDVEASTPRAVRIRGAVVPMISGSLTI